MFGGAYVSDIQWCGKCIDLLAKETFQKPVSVNKCDSAAGVKTSHRVGVKAMWQVLRGKGDGCNGVSPALEPKARP